MASADILIRLVYASHTTAADEPTRAADVVAILASARLYNGRQDVSGLLVAANGYFLQALEGPPAVINVLYGRIRRDARHEDVSLLSVRKIEVRAFPDWSMGLIERSEPPAATTERVQRLKRRLSEDASVNAADFFRLMVAPNAAGAAPGTPQAARRLDVRSVVFASPTGLWSAAVLQHVAAHDMIRTGRTHVADAADPESRTLIEYIDVDPADIGPLRALSLTRDPMRCMAVAPLIERLSLLVLMIAPSDAVDFAAYLARWAALPQVQLARPHLLLATSLDPARIEAIAETAKAQTGLPVRAVRVKLSDAAAVWQATQTLLRDLADASLDLDSGVAASEPSASLWVQLPSLREDRPAEIALPVLHDVLNVPEPEPEPAEPASAIDVDCLQRLLGIEGALHASVLSIAPLAALASACRDGAAMHGDPLADAQWLGMQEAWLARLGSDDRTDDITITTTTRLQVFRPLRARPATYLSVTLDREAVQLGIARLRVQEIEAALAD